MKKGFTLIEILVVVLIVGVLGSLGVAQYSRSVEKSRGAEAKAVIGVIRSMALAHWHEFSSLTPGGGNNFNLVQANIGVAGGIPADGSPADSSFFTYSLPVVNANSVTIRATRCSGAPCKGGVSPYGGGTISLTVTCPGGAGGDFVYSANAPWR